MGPEFVWQEKTLNKNYRVVYRDIWKGMEKCYPGRADGNVFTDPNKGYLDVYRDDSYGDRAQFLQGVIKIEETTNDTTLVKVGVQDVYDGNDLMKTKGNTRDRWLRFANGDPSCQWPPSYSPNFTLPSFPSGGDEKKGEGTPTPASQ